SRPASSASRRARTSSSSTSAAWRGTRTWSRRRGRPRPRSVPPGAVLLVRLARQELPAADVHRHALVLLDDRTRDRVPPGAVGVPEGMAVGALAVQTDLGRADGQALLLERAHAVEQRVHVGLVVAALAADHHQPARP